MTEQEQPQHIEDTIPGIAEKDAKVDELVAQALEDKQKYRIIIHGLEDNKIKAIQKVREELNKELATFFAECKESENELIKKASMDLLVAKRIVEELLSQAEEASPLANSGQEEKPKIKEQVEGITKAIEELKGSSRGTSIKIYDDSGSDKKEIIASIMEEAGISVVVDSIPSPTKPDTIEYSIQVI